MGFLLSVKLFKNVVRKRKYVWQSLITLFFSYYFFCLYWIVREDLVIRVVFLCIFDMLAYERIPKENFLQVDIPKYRWENCTLYEADAREDANTIWAV